MEERRLHLLRQIIVLAIKIEEEVGLRNVPILSLEFFQHDGSAVSSDNHSLALLSLVIHHLLVANDGVTAELRNLFGQFPS